MKIKGRLIATLAALGLLIAMLPIGPASAAVGTVGVTGGDDGKFFSDRTDFNIVTLSVTDPDLSPARVGYARFKYGSSPSSISVTAFDLKADPVTPTDSTMVLAGEKGKTDELDGTLFVPTVAYANPEIPTADELAVSLREYVALAGTTGEGVDKTFHYYGADITKDTADDRWIVTLAEAVRDSDGDGDVDEDDITVVVDGQAKTSPATQYVLKGADGDGGTGAAVPFTNRHVRLLAVPTPSINNIAITYEYSEFDQATSSTTPITLIGTRIRFGSSFITLNSEVSASIVTGGVVNTTAPIVIPVDGNNNPLVVLEIQFIYDVKETAKEYATVTSNTSIAGGQNLTLDGAETAADSSKFEEKIAVFESSDYSKIVQEASNIGTGLATGNDLVEFTGNGDEIVQVSELCNSGGLGKASTTDIPNDSLCDRVMEAAKVVMGVTDLSGVEATDLLALILPVADKDTLTVVYPDASPAATIIETAEIDLAAPVVTLISPAQGLYTSESRLTMSAEVVDDGSGVTQGNIGLVPVNASTGINLNQANTLRSPIADGYRVSNVPNTAISEGKKQWAIQVVDNVGNEPLKEIREDGEDGKVIQKAALGAVGKISVVTPNAFTFYVDTRGPTVTSARTGVYLKNPGVTTGEADGQETQDIDNRNWVRLSFDLGDGTAPLDASTVSASDFRVNGAEPTDMIINAKTHIGMPPALTGALKGSAVYLNVGQLDTDARPEVELVGEIKDRAGNVRSEGSVDSAIDGLSPIITATPSVDIAGDEVMVTVTSSERLGLNPEVELTTTKPEKGEELVTASDLTVALQVGTFTTWTGTETNPAGAANKWYVVVTASDQNGNATTIGDADSSSGGAALDKDDLISFQLDDAEPSVEFMDATGNVLKDSKQEEGAVWLVAQFDEDEHDDDKFLEVTVSEMTLKVQDGEDVTTDVAMLFGGDAEVDCADHDDTSETDECVNITLAVNLMPGDYTYTITGVDSVGNEVTGNVDFTVVETEPFELKLKPGVNLVSIPGAPRDDGGMLDVMLADAPVSTVLTYDSMAARAGANPWLTSVKDPETGVFSGDITMIEPGKSYFITSTASYTVNVKLEAAGGLPPTLSVSQGYNAIGFVSISDDEEIDIELYLNSIGWSVAYSYDPTPGIGWTTIRKGQSTEDNPITVEAGKGYLVYALYDSTLTP